MESSAAIKNVFNKSSLFRVLGALVLMVSASYAAAENRLVDVKFHSVVDHQLELQLIFEHEVMAPEIDLNASPAEIILGFSGSMSGLEKQIMPINTAGVEHISVRQLDGMMRVTVALNKVKAYKGKLKGNTYNLTINDEVADRNMTTQNPFINKINNIDFRRTAEGGGELLIKLDNSSVAANVKQVGSKLELQLYNTDIGSDLLYVMDVQDFATPVRSFETFKEELTTRILIDISGRYEYNYQQEASLFRLSIKKADKLTVAKKEKKYDGRSLSLNFQSISVRTVLQIIADYNDFNLVTSDTVEGDITL
ncbi:AMIN domain-containing protein, partial [Shewanella sp.]|uniref:AMIN domain-containing protein n=1 Tax=Shewanella sp. TaxID=50422 RepID=UPI001EB6ABD4|nr:type IV pilus secretin PilQ [Shewanella sp.]